MSKVKCYACGSFGHIKSRCLQNPRASGSYAVNFCLDDKNTNKFISSGTVNGANVSTILRDTGCSCIIVSNEVLPDVEISQCKVAKIADYLGRETHFPIVKCFIRCPYYKGWANGVPAPIKFCSVLVDNIPGVADNLTAKSCASETNLLDRARPVQLVQTRGSTVKPFHRLILP